VQLINSLTKTERYLLTTATIIFISASFVLGLRLYYKNTVAKPIAGGNYIEGIIGQPIAINPITATNEVDRDLIALMFTNILDLIENYKTSDDQRIWTLTLKKDLRWSDGQPLTSDDVLFTLQAIQDPETRSPLAESWRSVIGERLSEKQFRFNLREPDAFFLNTLQTFQILPRHIFEGIPPANWRLSDYNLKPVGNGPYKFYDYSKRKDGFITQYRLVVNDYYVGQRPFIGNFYLRFYSNKEDALRAFTMKKIDGIGGLDQRDLNQIKIAHQIFKTQIPGYYAIFFNPSLHPALKEKEVRQALTYAVDKNAIVSQIFGNYAAIVNGPLFSTSEYYDPEIYKNDLFSPDRTVAILESAKWKLNKDGIRTKVVDKKEIKLEFDLIVPNIEFLTKAAELIKNNWSNIGVKVNISAMRPIDVNNDIIKTRNYQMLMFGIILRNNLDLSYFWHSSKRFYPGGNLALYTNKTIDALLEEVKNNPNNEMRLQNLRKIQQIIHDDYPAVFLFMPDYIYVATKELKGFNLKTLATRSDRFQNVNEWYLKTARVFK